jgi:hypothetical protein
VSQVSQLQYVYHLYLNDTKSDFILQQALSNQSITDFLIIEYNGDIGGRMAHTNFGEDADGNPYVVELGANWVSQTRTFECK